MGTDFLLLYFYLTIISFGVVDCNNGTSEPPYPTLIENPTLNTSIDVTNHSKSKVLKISDEVKAFLQSHWLTRFIPSFYTVVFLLSLPLNVMAIIIFIFKTGVQVPSVVFMLNLAVADVLFIMVLPFDIVYQFLGHNWLIGEGMCRFVTSALYCNMYCSILLMTSISVDRFLSVVYPVQSLWWRSVSRAWMVCLMIWMVSISATIPLLISTLTVHLRQLNITTCYTMLEKEMMQNFYFPYFITYMSLFFFLPFIITTFCYTATIRSLSSPTIDSTHKKSRSVLLCATVLCEFIICFGPSNVLFLAHYLTLHKPIGNTLFFLYTIAVCVSSISCCLDPAVYYFGSSAWKKQVHSLICCGKSETGPKNSSRMTSGESSRYTS